LDIKKHVADRIKHYRKLKNLSQEALALDIGVSKPMVQRLESGIHWPRLENLEAIADRLGVEVSDFFTGLPPARPTPEQALEVIKAQLSQVNAHTAPASQNEYRSGGELAPTS
jgi:transcriptional regulator with XRE-family HTH domain